MRIARLKLFMISPLIVLPPLPASRYSPSVMPGPEIRTIGAATQPCCEVPSMTTVSVMKGSWEARVMVAAPVPIEKSVVCVPAIAFEFWMNWRSEPWIERFALPPSWSPSSAVEIVLNEKPELIPVTFAPATDTFVACSAVVMTRPLSETPAVRPPNSVPGPRRKPPPCAAPVTP